MFKILKSGFAAIIAILAISATIAAQAGAFDNTSLKPSAPVGCFPPSAITGGTLPSLSWTTGDPQCKNVTGTFCVSKDPAAVPIDCELPVENIICCYQLDDAGCTAGLFRVTSVCFGQPIE